MAFKQGKDLGALRDSLPGFFLIQVFGGCCSSSFLTSCPWNPRKPLPSFNLYLPLDSGGVSYHCYPCVLHGWFSIFVSRLGAVQGADLFDGLVILAEKALNLVSIVLNSMVTTLWNVDF